VTWSTENSAPAGAAPITPHRPGMASASTAPVPKIAMLEPAGGARALNTAPAPVDLEVLHPRRLVVILKDGGGDLHVLERA
jgi:hypothetical protein